MFPHKNIGRMQIQRLQNIKSIEMKSKRDSHITPILKHWPPCSPSHWNTVIGLVF